MTNREHLAQMSDDDLAEWLCRQMFPDYGETYGMIRATRFHTVRNFLKMEYTEEKKDDQA